MLKTIPAVALAMLALTTAAQAKDKKPVDPNRKVCREETSTGSIMPKRTCHTAAEWARIDQTVNSAGRPGGDINGQRTMGTPGFSGGN